MALTPAREGWWQRNRLWLVLLLPLVALALLASSWRLVTIYRPTEQLQPHRPDDGVVHLSQDVMVKGEKQPFSIEVSASAPVVVSAVQGNRAPEGMRLHQVAVTFRAPTDAPLFPVCDVTLHDTRGGIYRAGQGTEPVPGEMPGMLERQCVPAEHEGPVYDLLLGGVEQPDEGEERPAVWVVQYQFVLPADRTPEQLRVVYETPHYAVFELR